MPTIHLDFETRSKADLKKLGAYEYARHPSTDALCLAWALDDGPVHLWRRGDPDPTELLALIAAGALCEAWNVGFERAIWRFVMVDVYGWGPVPDSQWRCAMAKSQAHSLPGGLDDAAHALGTEHKKDKTGYALMLKLSRPRKPTKNNPSEWSGTPEEFEKLYEYCKQDVRTERAVSAQLKDLSPFELRVWQLDQRINERGIRVDKALCAAAIEMGKAAKADLGAQLAKLTDGAVSKASDKKGMIEWLRAQGVPPPVKLNAKNKVIETAETKSLKMLLQTWPVSDVVKRGVELFIAANKTSVAKYKAMMLRAGDSDRLRGMFVYHAASTGRWSARAVQLHNLPRPPKDLKNMEMLAEDILRQDYELLTLIYGRDRVLTVLSSALRGALTASVGRRLIAADFSAVETRAAAYLAGDEELLEVFRKLDADPKANWDVYTWQASQILGREVTKKDDEDRQNFGKVPTLGAVYQMSGKKLVKYAEDMGIKIELKVANKIIREWRKRRVKIVEFWSAIDEAAREAVRRRGQKDRTVVQGALKWKVVGRFLVCRLPSGRRLHYLDPKLEWKTIEYEVVDDLGNVTEVRKFNKETLTFMGSNTYSGKRERVSTYGGKLTENAVQAFCRDLLAEFLLALDEALYEIVLHVHDEGVSDAPEGFGSKHEAEMLGAVVPKWAPGLPLKAEGWVSPRFKKG